MLCTSKKRLFMPLSNSGFFKNCREYIMRNDRLASFAPRYKTEILEWIYTSAGKRFSGSELEVMGTGPSGESLI